MTPGFASILRGRRVLLAVASEGELRAILEGLGSPIPPQSPWRVAPASDRVDLVLTGIGKSNAAGGVARALDSARHAGVLSIGIGGSLPGSGLTNGSVVLAEGCVFADEGVQTPDRFLACDELGFPLGGFPGSTVPVDAAWVEALRPIADAAGPIATVSTCSGTDALAAMVRARTGALAEGMEGAAVALVAHRLSFPRGELRVISNPTGNRDPRTWDIPRAFARLREVTGRLF